MWNKQTTLIDNLTIAKDAISKQMKEKGYICDSDATIRYLDTLAEKLISKDIDNEMEIQKEGSKLLMSIKTNIMIKYNVFTAVDRGFYVRYYHNKKREFESLKEFEEYFEVKNK